MSCFRLWSRCFVLFFSLSVSGVAVALNFPSFPFTDNSSKSAKSSNNSSCPESALTADVVAIDHPMVFNRLGAQNVNWMMYALRHDIVNTEKKTPRPLDYTSLGDKLFEKARKDQTSSDIALRPDLRPRPLVLRVAAEGYLKVRFTNLLTVDSGLHPKSNDPEDQFSNQANPFDSYPDPLPNIDHPMEHAAKDPSGPHPKDKIIHHIDDQVASRFVGFHPQGLELVNSINDDSSFVGNNPNSMAAPGETKTYCFYAPKEGSYLVSSDGAVFGGEGTSGNSGVGLFAAVTVQPKGASFYRAQVTEEEMRLASSDREPTPSGQPNINYEATYPNDCASNSKGVWCQEGKAGKPILNMVQDQRIIHGDINALIMGPNKDGSFPKKTYPLEGLGKQNPALPNRLEPFREFVSIFHDENAATQAFPYFFEHPELKHTLHGVRDAFMINYGSGGVGAEIIANRLKAGPMQDCLDCAYEEFFLSAFAVGDAAMLVDKPTNLVTGQCQPEYIPKWIKDPSDPEGGQEILDPNHQYYPEFDAFCVQPEDQKATKAYYPHDPANVHHSYIGDFVKFRNLHSGKEQHIFHLHNHQWLFNPNDDNSNYIDAQGLGPGSGYTYEIAYGGSGNRNKTVGDSIFHCHFYPHFAQGMWYMWRHHDVFEAGTRLEVTGKGKDSYHKKAFALMDGKPAAMSRALPDGEIIAGTPIPAIVPLPGKAMPPIPEPVKVTKKENGKGSKAELVKAFNSKTKNPGYPFWIAGVTEHDKHPASIGSRPTTPPLDMTKIPGIVDGHDGGLPRHALAGYSAGGDAKSKLTRMTAEKHLKLAKPIYFDEKGTGLEKVAMTFHGYRRHNTHKIDKQGNVTPAKFITNGAPAVPGAPFNDPCIDDHGILLRTGGDGSFFGGKKGRFINVVSPLLPNGIEFGGDSPRVYKGANLQLDVVFNKQGYHYPQQRILTLWEDVGPLLDMTRPPEPLVMRMNTFDCAMYAHTNLVPKYFYADDYQITTPTDVIGQHIHLPKWDLTSADGGANGWNYEDGTFSPGIIRERIHAINKWNKKQRDGGEKAVPNPYDQSDEPLVPIAHPYFNGDTEILKDHQFPKEGKNSCEAAWKKLNGDSHKFDRKYGMPGKCDWFGARTTLQRWFSDPLVNAGNLNEINSEVHRGLGITFTHDHLGPSTHQQLGLYATMLTEPPGSKWHHNETGAKLYDTSNRKDGGPTSWQAVISGEMVFIRKEDGSIKLDEDGNQMKKLTSLDVDGDSKDDSHREFFLQFGDFQHAYQKGAYYGVDENGVGWGIDPNEKAKPTRESFRQAINPSVRKPATQVLPDIIAFEPTCPGGTKGISGAVYDPASVRPKRPCPEAISADDIGMMVVNYRNEPLGARVYDKDKEARDGKSGDQTSGLAGDLAFAMQTRTDRANKFLNGIGGEDPGDSGTAPHYKKDINSHRLPGDPFTPMMRAYSGDLVRIKIQGGAHEHEHNGSINGLGWMQAGSGFGQAPHSGWRNAQNIGLSEQFTLSTNITDYRGPLLMNDRMYTIDSSQDGMWNGVWGVLRSKMGNFKGDEIFPLPSNPIPTIISLEPDFDSDGNRITKKDRDNVCPVNAPIRRYDVAAVLANDVLDNSLGLTIPTARNNLKQTVPSAKMKSNLNADGGTLVYNPRRSTISVEVWDKKKKKFHTKTLAAGPLHDPTAIMFVRTEDLDENGKIKSGKPVEPLVLRAAAGECIQLALHNLLPMQPEKMPDLDGYTSVSGIITRDFGEPDSKMTTFNNNLLQPSNHISLHPQLVHYNIQNSDGNNVGINRISTTEPGKSYIYQWYAGVIDIPSIESCEEISTQDYKELWSISESIIDKDVFRPINFEEGRYSVQPLTHEMSPITSAHYFSSVFDEENEDNKKMFSMIEDIGLSKENFRQIFKKLGADFVEDLDCYRDDKHISDSESHEHSFFYPSMNHDKHTACRKEVDYFYNDKENKLSSVLLTKLKAKFSHHVVSNVVRKMFSREQATALIDELPSVQDIATILKQEVETPKEAGQKKEIHSAFIEHMKLTEEEKERLTKRSEILMQDMKKMKQQLGTKLRETIHKLYHPKEYSTYDKAYAHLNKDEPILLLNRKTTRLVKLSDECKFTAVEFGGTNLTPPDRIKQGQKGAIGALIIEPEKSSWDKYTTDRVIDRQNPGIHQSNKRETRTSKTVSYSNGGLFDIFSRRQFRDLVMVHQKGLNLRYADGSAVANIDAEKEDVKEKTVPEDAHDSGQMAINYGTEPMWLRFGLAPDAPFGKAGFGGVASAWQAFSSDCCDVRTPATGGTVIHTQKSIGEPYVPIMTVPAGSEMRIRALMPTGVGRASTVELHGHSWPRDPYLAENIDYHSFPRGSRPADWGTPSKCIGENPMAMHLGGQESVAPMAHFDMVFPRAGGQRGIQGDYLWRDHAGYGITNGLWALIRVEEPNKFLFWDWFAPTKLRNRCRRS